MARSRCRSTARPVAFASGRWSRVPSAWCASGSRRVDGSASSGSSSRARRRPTSSIASWTWGPGRTRVAPTTWPWCSTTSRPHPPPTSSFVASRPSRTTPRRGGSCSRASTCPTRSATRSGPRSRAMGRDGRRPGPLELPRARARCAGRRVLRAPHGPRAAWLARGTTLPSFRGLGIYRALVRARWDDAVRLGAGALVVLANVETSYPILERLRFRAVGRVRLLADRSATPALPP
jgi:hypothetical protein